MHHPHRLGACLYVPATHPQLGDIASGRRLADVRSLIYCTEDAVAEHELPAALAALRHALPQIAAGDTRNHFVRVRNPAVLAQVLAIAGVENLLGFVLPKTTADTLPGYAAALAGRHLLMPTLETAEVFEEHQMLHLRQMLLQDEWRSRILCLRIGGNDLLNCLHLRRPANATLYQTPVGSLIARLVGLFRPHGFHLSAPVFEWLDKPELLAQEVREDLRHGLTGKTAIHPAQTALIEAHYRVPAADIALARQILESKQAVFAANGAMQEPATHRNWARNILAAAEVFGSSD